MSPPIAANRLTGAFYTAAGRHFVSLSCLQQPPGALPTRVFVFSGFLIEAAGQWFYVTAGHILRDIRQSMAMGGKFERWRLDDQTAGNRFEGAAIPYDFDVDRWVVIENEEIGLDYAATVLEDFYCRQLAAGGSVPIGQAAWGNHVAECDQWAIIGVPSETLVYDGKTVIQGRISVLAIEPAEPPETAGRKAENKFYARIKDLGNVRDIDGMSGGPVFGLKKLDGMWKYWVLGVQSAWYPKAQVIAACPISSFALELGRLVELARRSTSNG